MKVGEIEFSEKFVFQLHKLLAWLTGLLIGFISQPCRQGQDGASTTLWRLINATKSIETTTVS